MDTKKQLETQIAQHLKTREQLSAAQLELTNLRLQLNSGESRLASPAVHTGETFYLHSLLNIHKFT